MALGGICGSLLGGFALTNLQIDKIFLLFSVLPTIQLFSCGLVKEHSFLPEVSTSNGSHMTNGSFDEDKSSTVSKTITARRKKGRKKARKAPVVENKFKIPGKDGSLASQWFQSLKMACYALFRAFCQPMILR